jgi:hypothetical protein
MSLDGFVTGPNAGVGNPMGDDDGRLHDWMVDTESDADAGILEEIYRTTGAIVIGKRMFDVGEEPWGDPLPSICRYSSSPTSRENRCQWRAARRIRSWLTGSKRPSRGARRPLARGTLASGEAPASRSST